MDKERIVKYDILRIAACFAIVLLHVSASYWSVVDIYGREFQIMTIYNSLTRFAVPVFFMLSGLFLLSPKKENDTGIKRILKIIILFYLWSAFYAFQGLAVDMLKGEFSQEVLRDSIERFIFGHVHMWFLQMLCGFYILIPIGKAICAKKETLQYYIFCWILFKYLIPCLTSVFHLDTFQARIDSLGLDILVGNFGYFLLGYYLHTIDIKKHVRYIIYILGMGSLLMTIVLTIGNSRATGTYIETWFSPASMNVLLMSIAIFTRFEYSNAFEKMCAKQSDLWKKLANYTFFVYMFHMFIIEKLNLIGITTVSYPAIISIPLITLFTFLVSMLGAFIVDHIKILKKLFMLH